MEGVIVELGCGPNKGKNRIGVDILHLPGVDIVADLNLGLPFFKADSVDEIYAKSVFEHICDFDLLMSEVHRVLKKNGIIHIFVPHFSNPYYYSDPTHCRQFGLYTFFYYVEQEKQLSRKVPNFYGNTRFEVNKINFVFRSRVRGIRYIKGICGRFFNKTTWLQEFYEENLSYLLPCYGLEIELCPSKHLI